MSTRTQTSAALPIAYGALRILIVLNWLSGLAILTLLVAMPTRRWIMSSLHLFPSAEAERVIFALYSIAVLGLVAIPLNYLVLNRLLALVDTVRAGDPFIAANATRLQAIAWTLLALNVLSIVIEVIVR